jgi:hypothetical protein
MPNDIATVLVRAYTKEGYHKDIARLDCKQVRSSYGGMEISLEGAMAFPNCAVGVSVDPKSFPEMVRFEVLVERQ